MGETALSPTVKASPDLRLQLARVLERHEGPWGTEELEMAHRGDREQLTIAPGQFLDNPYSLNTVDVCPVGALTSKDFRFQMRAWELYTTPSVCAGCATGCNTEIHHAKGVIYRIVPRENPDVNKFWMCDDGVRRFFVLKGNVSDIVDAPLSRGVRFELTHERRTGKSIPVTIGLFEKTEFDKFGPVLAKVKKKLEEATNTIDEAGRRERAVKRRLKDVEAMPPAAATDLLGFIADDGDGEEGESAPAEPSLM